MTDKNIFVDTNILIYAHDSSEKGKHEKAKEKILELWHQAVQPVISVQVIEES